MRRTRARELVVGGIGGFAGPRTEPNRGRIGPAVAGSSLTTAAAGNGGISRPDVSRTADVSLTRVQCSAGQRVTLAHAWGAALAQLHQRPVSRQTRLAPRPWVLDPDDVPDPLIEFGSPAAVELWLRLRRDRAVRSALARVDREWRTVSWLHGDVSNGNVQAHLTDQYRWRISFVDVALAGRGDPAWDLATAYESLGAEPFPLDRRGSVELKSARQALLIGYRDAGGTARLDRPMLLARAVLTAVQLAGEPASDSARTAAAHTRVYALAS